MSREATLSGRNAPDQLGAVCQHLARMELALTARNPLNDDACVVVDKNAHNLIVNSPYADSMRFLR
jgi:hypothetical protein